MSRTARWLAILMIPVALMIAGCGPTGPEVADVEGTVTLDGQPLSGAMVIFTPAGGGRPSAGKTNEEGWYELIYSTSTKGALPGEHRVEISTFQSGDPGQDIEAVPETLPARYNARTELTKTVEPEENVIDFELKSDGEVIQPMF